MNIFYVDSDPVVAAQSLFDTHVVKMIVESAQLLSTAHRILDGIETIEYNKAGSRMRRWHFPEGDIREEILYKSTHFNHPSAIWVRESCANYQWLFQHWIALMQEYTHRYGKNHASERLICYLANSPSNISIKPFRQVTPAMDDAYIICKDSIINYRNYYIKSKMSLMAYTNRQPPLWLVNAI